MTAPVLLSTGRTHTSIAARAVLTAYGVDMATLLDRHANGDWGEITLDDEQENGLSLVCGGPIVSQFKLSGLDSIRIVTDTFRKTTRINLATEPSCSAGHASHSFGGEALAA
ncbi:hypothetical protein NP603_19360 [Methylomonas sp. SURF-1]|uniref:Uncharacterized protein n=1 Tax=Methylomonas aurea TaxID=2952224 RepID=A0ABT1UM16_9GAMM|nr:hypothetical protein [Methylomonas sp. SURF-1]MCQ8183280.1 hypothetical protein [Methylomonas sp. SURF-1]